MADLLGVDRSTYSYYELGKIKPDIKTIMKLADIFGVHYTDILESEKSFQFHDSLNSNSKNFNINNITPSEQNILKKIRSLSKDSQNDVVNFINKEIKKSGKK